MLWQPAAISRRRGTWRATPSAPDRRAKPARFWKSLAALDYQAGDAAAAREHYQTAVNNFDQPPAATPAERASTLANYGALALLNGDRPLAEDLLRKALAQAPDPALRSQILNNLGVIAQNHP